MILIEIVTASEGKCSSLILIAESQWFYTLTCTTARIFSFHRKVLGILRVSCGLWSLLTTLASLTKIFPSQLQSFLPRLYSSLKLCPITVTIGTGCLPWNLSLETCVLLTQDTHSVLFSASQRACGKTAWTQIVKAGWFSQFTHTFIFSSRHKHTA